MSTPPRRVVVLGGGITGLAAAYDLSRLGEPAGVETVLLESSERLGGKVMTVREGDVAVEAGPDSFVTTKPHALSLVEELGLSGELLGSDPRGLAVSVFSRGRLRPLPPWSLAGPSRVLPFVFSGLMSWPGKLRVAFEPLVPPAGDSVDETLAQFVRRRLGSEALDLVVGPMLAGLYAGDPEAMSLKSAFPELRELERRGGLLKASLKRRSSPAGRSLFMTLEGGLGRLVETLADRIRRSVRVHLSTPVTRIARRGAHWTVETPRQRFEAQAVVSALPAPRLADVLEEQDWELSQVMREIPFADTATVSLAYRTADLPRLSGTGFLVPRAEGLGITAATFSTAKFKGRAPEGTTLIRVFVGGAGRGADVRDARGVAALAESELARVLGLGGARPAWVRAFSWPQANPQYNVGHELRLRRIDSCLKGNPGLLLAGCSWRGIGLPDCIHSGRRAAGEALRILIGGRRAAAAEAWRG